MRSHPDPGAGSSAQLGPAMRLTVLGGSAASPNAGMGCAGLLVQTGRTRLVLDLGTRTLQELRRHTDFRTLSGDRVAYARRPRSRSTSALRHALAYNPLLFGSRGRSGCRRRSRFDSATAPFDACDEPGASRQRSKSPSMIRRNRWTIYYVVVTFAPTKHYLPAWAIQAEISRGPCPRIHRGQAGPAAALVEFFAGVRRYSSRRRRCSSRGADPGMNGITDRGRGRPAGSRRVRGDPRPDSHVEELDSGPIAPRPVSCLPGPNRNGGPRSTLSW